MGVQAASPFALAFVVAALLLLAKEVRPATWVLTPSSIWEFDDALQPSFNFTPRSVIALPFAEIQQTSVALASSGRGTEVVVAGSSAVAASQEYNVWRPFVITGNWNPSYLLLDLTYASQFGEVRDASRQLLFLIT
jgi:hypothetical protein